ncbi:nuclear transport factor 2 family protein [Brachybacterium endophyticum]|uniref:Nuclear transport factor 2 family protein n=1 Tax=Brachybacterium endophyticum TaxID=2182385 RepID=A0A2U2RMN3_9MICO|nr:nuclear transport factor 2 family protein [Brachybacterium endophyticum]PWH07106.1 nuclear transport factor 2 family protein [Brachybacterium endophyticum]
MSTPREIAEMYFECWRTADFEPLREHLHPEVTFDGTLGSTRGPEEFIEGVTGLARATEDLEIRARLADDSDVMTWFRLVVGGGETEVVNWAHVEHGLLRAVRVTFDPRPLLGDGG